MRKGSWLGQRLATVVTCVRATTQQYVGLRGVLLPALLCQCSLVLVFGGPVEDAGLLDLLRLEAEAAGKRCCASLDDCATCGRRRVHWVVNNTYILPFVTVGCAMVNGRGRRARQGKRSLAALQVVPITTDVVIGMIQNMDDITGCQQPPLDNTSGKRLFPSFLSFTRPTHRYATMVVRDGSLGSFCFGAAQHTDDAAQHQHEHNCTFNRHTHARCTLIKQNSMLGTRCSPPQTRIPRRRIVHYRATRSRATPCGRSAWQSFASTFASASLVIGCKRLPRYGGKHQQPQAWGTHLGPSTSSQVLEQLTGQQPVFGKARYTVRSFSIRRNEKISVSVTVRGEKAMQLLESGLKVKEYELLRRNFSDSGNFGTSAYL